IGGLLMLSKKYRKCGFVLTSTVLINSFTVNFVFKNIIRRPRPFVTYPEEKLITKKPVGYSFPSGHAVTSFAAATILTANNPIFGLATIPLATLISFTRMYLFVHYPSDVACGILIGIGTGATAYNLQKKAYSK
ncbi:MAG: phosphatase PAP2 family protein, partial [Eubacterium sp.]